MKPAKVSDNLVDAREILHQSQTEDSVMLKLQDNGYGRILYSELDKLPVIDRINKTGVVWV